MINSASLIRAARYEDTQELDLCRALIREYAAQLNASAGGEHICVTSLDQELEQLPAPYAPPAGALLLAFAQGAPAGIVAVRPLPALRAQQNEEIACEMKRLWVRPAFQGLGLGRRLAGAALEQAQSLGYAA